MNIETEWRSPRYFIPGFLTVSAWIPAGVFAATDDGYATGLRIAGALFSCLGILAMLLQIRAYRRRHMSRMSVTRWKDSLRLAASRIPASNDTVGLAKGDRGIQQLSGSPDGHDLLQRAMSRLQSDPVEAAVLAHRALEVGVVAQVPGAIFGGMWEVVTGSSASSESGSDFLRAIGELHRLGNIAARSGQHFVTPDGAAEYIIAVGRVLDVLPSVADDLQ